MGTSKLCKDCDLFQAQGFSPFCKYCDSDGCCPECGRLMEMKAYGDVYYWKCPSDHKWDLEGRRYPQEVFIKIGES